MRQVRAFMCRPEEALVFDVLIKHRAAVFGGYIRDIIAEAVPNDIDCVVEESRFNDLEDDLVALGYCFATENDGSHITYTHPTLLPLDVISHEDIDEGEIFYLGPTPIPDFDVNLLTYGYDPTTCAYNLYNFVDIDTVEEIVEHVKTKTCYQFGGELPDQERTNKILKKGYEIAGTFDSKFGPIEFTPF